MEKESVFTFAKWQIKPGKVSAVTGLLKDVVEKSRAEAGNSQYQVFKVADDDNTLILFEAYENKEALEFHRSSRHFQDIVIGRIIPLLESREIVLASELNFQALENNL